MRKILFSPVGGTDPISVYNMMDGSLLHICRHYRPDYVILYMSKEMLEYEKNDHRYTYCLDKLSEKIQWNYEYRIIPRPELTSVHDFDYFYQDFRGIIAGIMEEMEEDDELLLNISSGTPQMKSGLLVLKTLGEFPCRLIQVSTPEKKRNVHEDITYYQLEELWELNGDNETESENRCKEVQCPTLSKLKNEEIIKNHIAVYDYEAAYAVAKLMPREDTCNYIELLKIAASRLLLDFDTVDELCRKTGFKCTPVKDKVNRKYFEYALSLDVKRKRHEYVDFIRAITPIIVDLLQLVLEKQCGINIKDYSTRDGQKWDKAKFSMSEQGIKVHDCLLKEFNEFHFGFIYSEHLRTIIRAFCADEILVKTVDDIRTVEANVRNLAAHQIVSITDEKIKELTGFNSHQIMDMIKRLFLYVEIAPNTKIWDSYNYMNDCIIEKMH